MQCPLFVRVAQAVEEHSNYFKQCHDATGLLSLSQLQKITATLKELAYEFDTDSMDEYLCLSGTAAINCLLKFCASVIDIHLDEDLHYPNHKDVDRLLIIGSLRGFPGMLALLNCMHWQWKNCPCAWAGQYQGKEKVSEISMC